MPLALALILAGAVLVLMQRGSAAVPDTAAAETVPVVPMNVAAAPVAPGAPPGAPPAGPDRWTSLVEECVELSKELDGLRVDGTLADPVLAEHVLLRLQQILERCGVESISEAEAFDRRLHRPTPGEPKPSPGAWVAEVLSPGFRIGERVLLRARVRLSTTPPPETSPASS